MKKKKWIPVLLLSLLILTFFRERGMVHAALENGIDSQIGSLSKMEQNGDVIGTSVEVGSSITLRNNDKGTTKQWSCTDSSIAQIYPNGASCRVKGVRPGQVTVSCISSYLDVFGGGNIVYDMTQTTVTVVEKQTTVTEVEGVTEVLLSQTTLTLAPGERMMLVAEAKPESAQVRSRTFSSSNRYVANTDRYGNVYGLNEGNAVITVTVNGKVKAECKVTVTKAGAAETPQNTGGSGTDTVPSETLYVGETLALGTSGQAGMRWSSSDQTVAQVSSKGKIKAKNAGITCITATATDGTVLRCQITVKSVISVSKANLKISRGKTGKVSVTYRKKKGKVRFRIKGKKCISCKWSGRKRNKMTLVVKAKKKGKTSIVIGNSFSREKKVISVTVR